MNNIWYTVRSRYGTITEVKNRPGITVWLRNRNLEVVRIYRA